MKPRNLALLVSGAVAVLVMVVGDAAPARAQPGAPSPTKVKALRVDNVMLYVKPNGEKAREYPNGYPRAQFTPPWPIVGTDPTGFLQVQIGDKKFWVRGYAVETDTPFRVNADCKAVVGSRQPKAGVTRGIGEECK